MKVGKNSRYGRDNSWYGRDNSWYGRDNSWYGGNNSWYGGNNTPLAPNQVAPVLKATVSMGNQVNISGSMQGMDALRVEYAPKGGSFTTVAFLTKTPGGFQITPTNPSGAETGFIRAVFIKKNEEFGSFSSSYPVTVS